MGAIHDYVSDPRSEISFPFDLATVREDQADKGADSDWAVPVFFQADEVDANGFRCYWANWPYLHGHRTIDIKLGVVLYLHGGAFVAGNPDVRKCAQLSGPLARQC